MHLAGCRGFWLWTLVGALLAFGVVAVASIGLFFLPLAFVAVWAAARRAGHRREALGTLAGAGATCLLVAWIQRGPGGFEAIPWLVAGAALAAAGAGLYGALARRDRARPDLR